MKKGKEATPHIGIYGRRNNGKSTLINRIAKQNIAIVSDVAGTTTDPVRKSFEIGGIGPAILIDTAGVDDVGKLGQMRIDKTLDTIKKIDMALLVLAHNGWGAFELQLIDEFRKYDVPYLVIHNKEDLEQVSAQTRQLVHENCNQSVYAFNHTQRDAVDDLLRKLKNQMPESAYKTRSLIGDLVSYGDIVLLITPIDIEAPEGRMILPQVQTIRDILDNDCIAIVLKEREVDGFLRKTQIKPKLAITDSQIFLKADASIPKDIPLTSFSIVLAKLKGDFDNYIAGAPYIDKLQDGDRVLMLESCSHHVACDDIGRVKIPRWISNYTGKNLHFDAIAGLNQLVRPVEDYALVIQCGGCVVTEKQLRNRLKGAVDKHIPVTNYGMAISYVQGIFTRAVAPFVQKNTDYNYL